MGAKQKILDLLLKNISVPVHRDRISDVANVHDWARVVRTLRQEGWDINLNRKEGTYTLMSDKKSRGVIREPVSKKERYELLKESLHSCQGCGAKASEKVKLHIDHKIPVDLGGTSARDNLWVLCSDCNLGKKNWFAEQDSEMLKKVLEETSAERRLSVYFDHNPNKVIDIATLAIIGGTREWTRSIRYIREKQNKKINYVKDGNGEGYIYTTED